MFKDPSHLGRRVRRALAVGLCAAALPAMAGALPFCGGAAQPAGPGERETVVGDLSLQHAAGQPAGMVTCAMGYLLAKCGDHENAHAVFDKCIAAGYVGAMIWKALLHEDGAGVPQDSAKAAELFRRAATSDSDYAALGKLHYATALYQGRGVPRDEAAAIQWFQAAADEGNEDAREFLRAGYHVGSRDGRGVGVGAARAQIEGQRLERAQSLPTSGVAAWSALLIASIFAAGMFRQAWPGSRRRQALTRTQGAQA